MNEVHFWLALVAVIFLMIRLTVILINYVTEVWLKPDTIAVQPLVSVLIPARNEEQTIGHLLESLHQQDYQALEIIVYNDQSTDNTGQVIEDARTRDTRIRQVQGHALPQGWLGKPHACQQLSTHAKGEFLLFLDADVTVQPGLIESTLAYMQRHDLHLLSLFPTQRMVTWGEKLVVPLMNWILLSLLPLILIRESKRPSLSAANGQFMLFRAQTYYSNQWHEQARQSRVEDIDIARLIKKNHYRVMTLLGNRFIHCRMYTGFSESVNGLGRSLLAFFGNSWLALLLFIVFTTLGPVFSALAFLPHNVVFYLVVVLAIRTISGGISNQPATFIAVTAPLQHLAFLWVSIRTAYLSLFKRWEWKGRKID